MPPPKLKPEPLKVKPATRISETLWVFASEEGDSAFRKFVTHCINNIIDFTPGIRDLARRIGNTLRDGPEKQANQG